MLSCKSKSVGVSGDFVKGAVAVFVILGMVVGFWWLGYSMGWDDGLERGVLPQLKIKLDQEQDRPEILI